MVNQEASPTPEELLKMDQDFFQFWLESVKRVWKKERKNYKLKNGGTISFMDWFIFQAWIRDRDNFIKTVFETTEKQEPH